MDILRRRKQGTQVHNLLLHVDPDQPVAQLHVGVVTPEALTLSVPHVPPFLHVVDKHVAEMILRKYK